MNDTATNSPNPRRFRCLRRFARNAHRQNIANCAVRNCSPTHPHLLETENAPDPLLLRALRCALQRSRCGHNIAAFRAIPAQLQNFVMSDELWQSLMIPINLAFFYRQSATGIVVAMYPSPAGAIESTLSFDTWSEIESQNPVLSNMQPEVETLLVNRVGQTREYYLAPIDQCYQAGGTHSPALEGALWRQRGLAAHRAVLRRASREKSAGRRSAPCLISAFTSRAPKRWPTPQCR